MTNPDPYYRMHVFCCTNERPEKHPRGSCARGGLNPDDEVLSGVKLRDYMKARAKELGLNGSGGVRINASGCLDRCELGPVMVIYPEGTWYRVGSFADVDAVLTEHVQNGVRVERLMLDPDEKA